jgi:alpha-amylase/alpha-mannosidase (GH57 family)
LDWLSVKLAAGYEDCVTGYLKEPWEARNDYIDVMLDRSEENVAAFLLGHSLRPLDEEASAAVLSLLEMQRHAMLMYTSCGWFFDELSGLETVQIIQYAGRAMQLAERYCIQGIEALFLERLALAGSNIPELANGTGIYEKFVRPVMIDLIKVGAHYAVSSVFEEYGGNRHLQLSHLQGGLPDTPFRSDESGCRQDIHQLRNHPQCGPDQFLQPALRRSCLELRCLLL